MPKAMGLGVTSLPSLGAPTKIDAALLSLTSNKFCKVTIKSLICTTDT